MSFLKAGGGRLLDFLFPPTCPLCRTDVSKPFDLCESCFEQLPPAPDRYCLCCGGDAAGPELGCGRCMGFNGFSDRAYFPFIYQGLVADLLVSYKFSDRSEFSRVLGRLCWHRLASELSWEEPDLILPIPLHPRRLLSRRYNQSALFAAELAEKLNRPLVTNGLKRIKMTTPQTRLSRQSRLENVQGAFWADPKRIAGQSVLVVDDVYTTGATMAAAVQTLHRVGARRIVILCFARSVVEH
ncbi:MAG: ComF family protein [Magnetococcales bacterium]|nr:ComF family protein [Magnetococcales bacterium]